MLKALIEHPLTRGMDLDDPRTTGVRREVILAKPFLRDIYRDWYAAIAKDVPGGPGAVLEIGSGAGFFDEYCDGVIRSEMFSCPGIRVVLNGLQLPFRQGALRGIAMTNVLHHLPRPRRFFADALECVRPGGVIVMIEPWVTRWSTLIYTRLHHEPFDPNAEQWEFPSSGPLSGANGALPWIMFERDRSKFLQEFPQWSIERVSPLMPFRYLVSGGVSLRSLMPGWSSGAWSQAEKIMGDRAERMAMFAKIVVRRLA